MTGSTSSSNTFASLQPGHWFDIANSHMAGVAYNGPLASQVAETGGPWAVMGAWSGGTFDPNSDSLIVWGGGHSDYAGNEVYAFNLATLSWTEVTNPSSTAGGDNNGVLSDGTPVSRHTYDGMTFISGTNQMFETSGADAPTGGSDGNAWLFDPTTKTWATGG